MSREVFVKVKLKMSLERGVGQGMDPGVGGREMGGDGSPGRGKAINKIQAHAVSFHLAPEQSGGEGWRGMRSARLAGRAL